MDLNKPRRVRFNSARLSDLRKAQGKMIIEKSAWYNELKYGTLIDRVMKFNSTIWLLIKVLSLQLLCIGGFVFGVTYLFENFSGTFLSWIMTGLYPPKEFLSVFKHAWSLKSLNINRCLSNVTKSLRTGSMTILFNGLICMVLGFSKSKIFCYASLLGLLVGFAYESYELKRFDNILTPLQASTMAKLKNAIRVREKQLTLDKSFMSALDFLMVTGDCCGVIGGADMEFYDFKKEFEAKERRTSVTPESPTTQSLELHSPCWHLGSDTRNKTGCYVHFFETSIKPFVRIIYGLSMLIQVI
ncbi:hypothetical protein EGW08_013610, partial [Elysia chlorotica]